MSKRADRTTPTSLSTTFRDPSGEWMSHVPMGTRIRYYPRGIGRPSHLGTVIDYREIENDALMMLVASIRVRWDEEIEEPSYAGRPATRCTERWYSSMSQAITSFCVANETD